MRFVQDDAFITYRYARNLARGEGLVFNPGERVEGYTNFLWTVMHWLPERYGWSSPVFSQVVGIALDRGELAQPGEENLHRLTLLRTAAGSGRR